MGSFIKLRVPIHVKHGLEARQRVDFQGQQIKVLFLGKQERKCRNQIGSHGWYFARGGWGEGRGTCWKKGHPRDTGKLYLFSTKHFDFGM